MYNTHTTLPVHGNWIFDVFCNFKSSLIFLNIYTNYIILQLKKIDYFLQSIYDNIDKKFIYKKKIILYLFKFQFSFILKTLYQKYLVLWPVLFCLHQSIKLSLILKTNFLIVSNNLRIMTSRTTYWMYDTYWKYDSITHIEIWQYDT